jgi:peptidoglycan hydrolase-like protein with peptidoglycan-binding domain
MVQASINERGGISGGQSGDQTGREIGISTYRNYPWDIVLRYVGEEPEPSGTETVGKPGTACPTLRLGDTGGAVLSMQTLLIHKWAISCGPDGADADFGQNTAMALEKFQNGVGLEVDRVCGPKTWAAIIGGKNGSE